MDQLLGDRILAMLPTDLVPLKSRTSLAAKTDPGQESLATVEATIRASIHLIWPLIHFLPAFVCPFYDAVGQECFSGFAIVLHTQCVWIGALMGAVPKAHAPRIQVQLHDVEHLIGNHIQVLLEDQGSPDQSDERGSVWWRCCCLENSGSASCPDLEERPSVRLQSWFSSGSPATGYGTC